MKDLPGGTITEMVSTVLANGLEVELYEKLGYSKYDYRNKEMDIAKTLKTSLGDIEIAIPRDRKSDFEPQIAKKNQTTLIGDTRSPITYIL